MRIAEPHSSVPLLMYFRSEFTGALSLARVFYSLCAIHLIPFLGGKVLEGVLWATLSGVFLSSALSHHCCFSCLLTFFCLVGCIALFGIVSLELKAGLDSSGILSYWKCCTSRKRKGIFGHFNGWPCVPCMSDVYFLRDLPHFGGVNIGAESDVLQWWPFLWKKSHNAKEKHLRLTSSQWQCCNYRFIIHCCCFLNQGKAPCCWG